MRKTRAAGIPIALSVPMTADDWQSIYLMGTRGYYQLASATEWRFTATAVDGAGGRLAGLALRRLGTDLVRAVALCHEDPRLVPIVTHGAVADVHKVKVNLLSRSFGLFARRC